MPMPTPTPTPTPTRQVIQLTAGTTVSRRVERGTKKRVFLIDLSLPDRDWSFSVEKDKKGVRLGWVGEWVRDDTRRDGTSIVGMVE